MKALREKNATAHVYYCEMIAKSDTLVACVSYKTFSKSHAFGAWLEKNSRKIILLKDRWQELTV